MTPHAATFAAVAEDGRQYRRRKLRDFAEAYERRPADLYSATFPGSREHVFRAVRRPDDPRATKALCHALYGDLRLARGLPSYLQGKRYRVDRLRELFAAECWRYRNQTRRLRAAAE